MLTSLCLIRHIDNTIIVLLLKILTQLYHIFVWIEYNRKLKLIKFVFCIQCKYL